MVRLDFDKLEEVLRRCSDVRITVVGDLMLDVYLTGPVNRISPEAPVPVVQVEEERGVQMRMVGGGASLSSLVNGLNALGVSPRDMISILQAIKAAGALQADIEVM